jgi:flavorubredoxin
MNNLYRMNARVREMADKWIASQEGQEAKAAYADMYTNPNDRVSALTAHATDEALARIAEELKTGKKIGTGQRAFVRSIAKWLANVADKLGLRQVAQSIRSATYTEVEKFVQEAMTAAVGAGPVNVRLTRRFAQAAATASDAFKRWFKDSQKVRRILQLKSKEILSFKITRNPKVS